MNIKRGTSHKAASRRINCRRIVQVLRVTRLISFSRGKKEGPRQFARFPPVETVEPRVRRRPWSGVYNGRKKKKKEKKERKKKEEKKNKEKRESGRREREREKKWRAKEVAETYSEAKQRVRSRKVISSSHLSERVLTITWSERRRRKFRGAFRSLVTFFSAPWPGYHHEIPG